MTITYEYGDNLYINVTNRCPNACDFCLRNNSTGSLYADNLWYEGAEPTKEEILADLKKRDLNSYAEDCLLRLRRACLPLGRHALACRALKGNGQLHLRVNTNGLADCITGVTPRRKCTGFWTLCPSA